MQISKRKVEALLKDIIDKNNSYLTDVQVGYMNALYDVLKGAFKFDKKKPSDFLERTNLKLFDDLGGKDGELK